MLLVKEMEEELKKYIPNMEKVKNMEEEEIMSYYLGSYMSMDPCGKYHHLVSLSGITKECEKYWENLEKAAERLGGYITSGEGDPTDIFFEIPVKEKEEEDGN